MKKINSKKEEDKKLFEKFKKLVDSINNEDEELLESLLEEDNIFNNLALKAEDLVYNLERVWEIKPDDLGEKEKEVLIGLLRSSKQLRNKIIKIIKDIKYEDPNIGRA